MEFIPLEVGGSRCRRNFAKLFGMRRFATIFGALCGWPFKRIWPSSGDCTTMALVPESAMGRAELVARQEGVVAGLPAAETALAEIDPRVHWEPSSADGDVVPPGGRLAADFPGRPAVSSRRNGLC